MRAQVSEWVNDNYRTYFSNATSTRDYRVQMRGSRSVLFFTLYLGSLISLAWLVYSNTLRFQEVSISQAQQSLKNFYEMVLGALGFIVSVVPPVMAATAVISEKQRHSFDLVFSAPVTAKYYLVGKLISSFRYTWMVLVLSLPVTAACVVLGGAGWTDVLTAYFMLSVVGVLLSSIALAASVVMTQPVQAVVTALTMSLAFNLLVGSASAASAYSWHSGAGANEMPFYTLLSPFFIGKTATSHSVWAGLNIPNFIPATLAALLASKFVLTCSGVQLMPYRAKAAANVRIHCLLYGCLIPGVAVYNIVSATASSLPFGTSTSAMNWGSVGVLASMYVFALSLSTPIACFTLEGENRLKPNGLFNWRHAFDGTPAGHLPFFLLMTGSVFLTVAIACGLAVGNYLPTISFWTMLVFSCGLWVFGWGIARFTSTIAKKLTQSQGLAVGITAAVFALPVPIITMLVEPGTSSRDASAWDLYLLRPLGYIDQQAAWRPLGYAAVLISVGLWLALISQVRVARMKQRKPEAARSAA